jgi:sodium/potassium/calcium exchanger 6
MLFTTYKEGLFPLAITVYSVWLVILFMALAVAADEYFCPATDVIAKTCR